MVAAAPLAACGGDDGDEAATTAPTATQTSPAEPPSDSGAEATGRELFTSEANPPCSSCHTLAEAGAEGTIGPNLDQLRPSAEQVRNALLNGPGVMPTYDGLGDQQVQALSEYVSQAAGA